MKNNQHGGARPKQRDDDGRVNNRFTVHPGRKPKSFTLKLGDTFYLAGKDADGNGLTPAQLWTVTAIGRGHVVMSSDNGNTYRLVR